MNKKLFSWKALAGLALLVAVGLTSCKQDNVIDPENPGGTKPSTDPTSTYVISGDDIAITALKPSDISEALTKLTAAASTRAAAKTYNVSINAASMKVTDADKTIVIPEVTDATWNITFDGAYAEDKAILVIKDDALDFVNIALPEAEFKGFDIETPYSTVTIDGAATIGELVVNTDKANVRDNSKRQTIGARCLTIGGVTVGGLDYVNGAIIVEDDAEIKAYIAGRHPNNGGKFTQQTWQSKTWSWKAADKASTYSVENVYASINGIEPDSWDDINNERITKYEAYDTDGDFYFLQDLIVKKTAAIVDETTGDEYKDYGYVEVYAGSRKNPIGQISIEDGAVLALDAADKDERDNATSWWDLDNVIKAHNYWNPDWTVDAWGNPINTGTTISKANSHYWVDKIVGLGDGTGVVIPMNRAYAFKDIESVSNVTIAVNSLPNNVIADESYIDGTFTNSITVCTDIDKCTFKDYTNVTFQSTTDEVKASKFPVGRSVRFNVDASKGDKAYDFNYNACEFISTATIGVNALITDGILLDEDGLPIVYTVWDYAKVSADGKSYVYAQANNVQKYDSKNKVWTNVDADNIPYQSNEIEYWTRKVVKTKYVEVTIDDPTKCDIVTANDGTDLYLTGGKYCYLDPADGKYYETEVKFVNVWEYNQKIDYTDIPTLARKDGLVNSREVYAMENYREINDMKITIALTDSKFGGKAVTKDTPVNASLPQYYDGNNSRNDAKMTYRFDLNGVLYRLAYDNVGKRWFFIKAN